MSTDSLFESTPRIPRGFEPDHTAPDQFVVRCTDCGVIDRKPDRGTARRRADDHAIQCAPTGVTPIARVEPDDLPQPDDIARLTYRSKRSGNLIDVHGVIVDVGDVDLGAIDLVVDDVDRERAVVVRYHPEREEADVARSITADGRTVPLGAVTEIEIDDVATDGGRRLPDPDDRVEIENTAGETSPAVVVDVHPDERADEFTLEFDGDPVVTLYEYWNQDVPRDDPVVEVRHAYELSDGDLQPAGGTYPYPASKVSPLAIADGSGVPEEIATTSRTLRRDDGPERYRVEGDPTAINVSYGPRRDADGWVLSVSTVEEGRVEIELDEGAMYTLWTEVRGVPWPDRDDDRDRDIRHLLHLANGADRERLQDAIAVLEGRR